MRMSPPRPQQEPAMAFMANHSSMFTADLDPCCIDHADGSMLASPCGAFKLCHIGRQASRVILINEARGPGAASTKQKQLRRSDEPEAACARHPGQVGAFSKLARATVTGMLPRCGPPGPPGPGRASPTHPRGCGAALAACLTRTRPKQARAPLAWSGCGQSQWQATSRQQQAANLRPPPHHPGRGLPAKLRRRPCAAAATRTPRHSPTVPVEHPIDRTLLAFLRGDC